MVYGLSSMVTMVAQNFAKLNKALSLVVNGHHKVPPRPTAWTMTTVLGRSAVRLQLIPSGCGASVGRIHRRSANGMAAPECIGNVPMNLKTFQGCHPVFNGSIFTDQPQWSNSRNRIFKHLVDDDVRVAFLAVGVNHKKHKRAKKLIILEN